LNSSNNNPGNGNLNGLKAKLSKQNAPAEGVEEEVIIKEEYEQEPDDYNYEPQIREVDEAEIRNLSAVRIETEVDTRVYKASLLFLVCVLIGAVGGYVWAIMTAGTAELNRKASIAKTVKNSAEPKIASFKEFSKDINSILSKKYDPGENNRLGTVAKLKENYDKYKDKIRLDMSSDVTTEAVILNKDGDNNPMKGLREYSAKSLMLVQLLGNHVKETMSERSSIEELIDKEDGGGNVTLAMQINTDFVYYLGTTAPRTQYANGVQSFYTYKDYIGEGKSGEEADTALATAFADYLAKNSLSDNQKTRRTYEPTSREKSELKDKIVPSRIMYEVINRKGDTVTLFADELVLVDREKLFGESANALQRYEQRCKQIQSLMKEIEQAGSNIVLDLNSYIGE